MAGQAVRAELVEGPDRRAVELLQRRPALERALGPLGVGEVQLRDRPARRALVDVDVRGRVRDRRHDLDRAAARPEHGHAAAGQVDVVAPAGGVERGAGEGVEPRQRGDARDRQLPAGGDQDVGGEGPRARLQRPAPVRRSAPRAPRSTCARPAAARARRGRPGSRPAARSGATSAGWARTRTRTGATGCRTPRPDTCCGPRRRRRAPRARTPSRRHSPRGAASARRRSHRSRHRRSPPRSCADATCHGRGAG